MAAVLLGLSGSTLWEKLSCLDAAYSLRIAGLQKLDLSHTVVPNQDLLGQLAGLSRLTALHLGGPDLLLPPLLYKALKTTVNLPAEEITITQAHSAPFNVHTCDRQYKHWN